MKRPINIAAILLSLLCISSTLRAQQPKNTCSDANIKLKVDALKEQYRKQNMVVFQEAMVQMVSMEPTPVAVKLLQGKIYNLIFVGSPEANKLTMEIFDGKDKRIDEKNARGSEGNIVYSFIPSKTDVYLVMLTQRKAAKNLCGSFTVMMQNTKPKPVVKTEQPAQQPAKEAQPASAPAKNQPVTNNPRYRPNVIKKTAQQPATGR